MQAIESVLFPIVSKINEYLSNYILVFLLIGVGLWYSIKTRFVQVRCFGEGMRKVFGNLTLKGDKQRQRYELLPGAGHRHRRSGGYRQHRRRFRRYPDRRPRRHLLDVGHRLLRHGYHLRRGHAGPEDPHRRSRTAPSTVAPCTTSPPRSRAASASSWRASSPWPSFWRWASWAAWCSPTPSAPP